ncbi:glycosyltransferase family 4 protein [Jatrophihabitans sp. YIM 134969]
MTGPTVLVAHPSTELYGSDRVMVETALGLRERGYRVVVTLPTRGPLTDHLAELGLEVVTVPSPVLRKSALSPRGLLRLALETARATPPGWRLLRERGVDVVVVNTITVPWWLVLARWSPSGSRPALCHVHEAERSAPRLVRRALTLPLLLARRVVTNSRFSRDVIADVAPRLARRTEVVLNAVPGPPVVVPARDTLEGPVRLLFVGRLSPRKGPDVAVAALAELVASGVDARLDLLGAVFPGYEPFEEQLRADVARLGLGDRVTFLGFEPDVWPRLAASDIAIVPSTVDEPFGNTAVEAVLAARPVVVSRTSGLVEAAAGYRGVVQVPPGDAGALAAAVRTVVEDWGRFRAAALADAATAADRHGPEVYRTHMADLVDALRVARPPRRERG